MPTIDLATPPPALALAKATHIMHGHIDPDRLTPCDRCRLIGRDLAAILARMALAATPPPAAPPAPIRDISELQMGDPEGEDVDRFFEAIEEARRPAAPSALNVIQRLVKWGTDPDLPVDWRTEITDEGFEVLRAIVKDAALATSPPDAHLLGGYCPNCKRWVNSDDPAPPAAPWDMRDEVAYDMTVFLQGAEMAPPVAPGWLAKIREWRARLRNEDEDA